MNLKELCESGLRRFGDISNIPQNHDNIYHVVIKTSALEKFNVNVTFFNVFHKDKHVHLIVQPSDGKPLKNSAEIQVEQIKFEYKLHLIGLRLFFYRSHDFFCNFDFTISLLKDMCIESLLKHVDYLHNLKKLNLPKKLFKEIFEKSILHFHLPEFDGRNLKLENEIFEYFVHQDVAFHKNFVFWFQIKKIFDEQLNDFFVVYYLFEGGCNLCLKCMKYRIKNGTYKRRYWLADNINKVAIIQNYKYWCIACQQVPLFQILTHSQFYNLYAYNINIVNTRNFYFNFLLFGKKNFLVKKDYFENGYYIKSEYVVSEKSFNVINCPYIN